MTEKIVQCVIYPRTLERVPDALERVDKICRAALVEAGCVLKVAGLDLTSWDIDFIPEHFDTEVMDIVSDAFHIEVRAPMPDAIEVAI